MWRHGLFDISASGEIQNYLGGLCSDLEKLHGIVASHENGFRYNRFKLRRGDGLRVFGDKLSDVFLIGFVVFQIFLEAYCILNNLLSNAH